jgi:hypothetical protein
VPKKMTEEMANAMECQFGTESGWEAALAAAPSPALAAAPAQPTGWRFDLENMPTDGRFEVLRFIPEVYRYVATETRIIEPSNGRLYKPFAWRLPTPPASGDRG